jgi:anti-repressor protein
MNITVIDRQIGTDTIQTVNARDLHAFLEVGKDFSNWIKDRINQYGFQEGIDYVLGVSAKIGENKMDEKTVISETGNNNKGGRPTKDYHITIDMAKELSMVERNEKGKQARQYFIECERKAKSNVVDITSALSDPNHLRNALLIYTEKVIELEAKVQEQAPKAKFHDDVAQAINAQSLQEVAKVLGTGPKRLFKFLREQGILMRNNLPYQQYIDNGCFKVVEKQYNDGLGESHTYSRTLVTGKGLAFIHSRIQKDDPFKKAS